MKNNLINIALLFLCEYGLCVSCDNNPSYTYQQTNCSTNTEPYLNYDTTGHIRKYFNDKWEIVHYTSKAAYYREACYINGRIVPDSLTRDYSITGQLIFEGYIASEEPNTRIGTGVWYHPDGAISAKITYDSSGRRQGRVLRYFPNGTIKEISYYKDDTLDGKFIRYYNNGHKEQVVNYKMGEKNGLEYSYYENGKLRRVYTFSCGILDGSAIEYYGNGIVRAKGMYVNGRMKGKWLCYDENGSLIKTKPIKINSKQVFYQRPTQNRSNYQELWDECEYYQDLLYENDITPYDELNYPMDYHELEDLRDELESQLQEEDIDY